MPLTAVLAEMEMTGALIDTKFFGDMSKELAARLSEIEKEIYGHVGKAFNINSPQQLSDVLFNHLRLEPPDKDRKTSTGFYSTSADVLDPCVDNTPCWTLSLSTANSRGVTYVDAPSRRRGCKHWESPHFIQPNRRCDRASLIE
ncbi:MAG: DNA polymerase [Anaerolineales bacterium]